MKPIYLDNHATTQVDPRVLKAMMPYFTEYYGNPSSRTHRYGWKAEEAIEQAREQVALLINAEPNQIIFTSGATESNNIAIHNSGPEHIMSAIEHSSIKNVVSVGTEEIKVNKDGIIDLDHLRSFFLGDNNFSEIDCVFIMKVNNEIGTVQPVRTVKNIVSWYTNVHSDMAQALGKIKVDVKDSRVDSASFSSHKIYGPKGVGALYIKEPEQFGPLIRGGSQEFGLRAGTQNVPGIVGFGKACEIVRKDPDYLNSHIKDMRDFLCHRLRSTIPNILIRNFPHAVSNTVSVAIPCKNMDMFMAELEPDVSVSFGSACMSTHNAQSYVLKAVSVPEEEILRTIRIGIGRFNTMEEMEIAAYHIRKAVVMGNSEE
jgi:cysteine desulfurase